MTGQGQLLKWMRDKETWHLSCGCGSVRNEEVGINTTHALWETHLFCLKSFIWYHRFSCPSLSPVCFSFHQFISTVGLYPWSTNHRSYQLWDSTSSQKQSNLFLEAPSLNRPMEPRNQSSAPILWQWNKKPRDAHQNPCPHLCTDIAGTGRTPLMNREQDGSGGILPLKVI